MLILILINPQRYMDATTDGLALFVGKVFPTLFPFMIICKILTMIGVGNLMSRIMKKPVQTLYNTSSISGYIMTLSMLSGYPIGAKLVADFVNDGELTIEDAKCIISFTSTSGPLFILGTIGIKMLGDYKAGVLILASHFISTLLNGLLYRGDYKEVNKLDLISFNDSDFFTQSVSSSINSILIVGANIIFLNLFIVVLNDMEVLELLSALLGFCGIDKCISTGIVSGLIEITRGASIISETINIKDTIVPISTIVSFGGVSVFLQSMAFLKPIGISARYYLLTKVSQAIITYVLSSILVLLLY